MDIELVDAHVHTYKSAEVALQALYGVKRCQYVGTVEDILKAMAGGGITKSVMLNMTPVPEMRQVALARLPKDLTPSQVEVERKRIDDELIGRVLRRNRWTCEVAREHPSLVPFVSVDPGMSPAAKAAEIEDLVRNWGAKGLKVHPAVQRVFPDDEAMWPVYEKAVELDLPVVFHSGAFDVPDGKAYADLQRFAAVLSAFPRLMAVLAHLGRDARFDYVDLGRRYSNVCFDTSAALSGPEGSSSLSNADAVKLIRSLGAERVLFGSDFNYYAPEGAAERFASLPLTAEEKRLVGAENARRLFKI